MKSRILRNAIAFYFRLTLDYGHMIIAIRACDTNVREYNLDEKFDPFADHLKFYSIITFRKPKP